MSHCGLTVDYHRRSFWVDGWNATSHDDSKPAPISDTTMELSTGDAPFFAFLGKARFEFYSNDTKVLGVSPAEENRRRKHTTSSKATDEEGVTELSYQDFPFGEKSFSLFNFNYDTSTGSAKQSSITMLQRTYGTLSCEDCYMYAGGICTCLIIP